MTRAALLGAVMGVVLGGAIVAVLALQMSVVELSNSGQTPGLPTATKANVEPPPATGIVSQAPGPSADPVLELDRFSPPSGTGAVTAAQNPSGGVSRSPQAGGLGDTPRAGGGGGDALADLATAPAAPHTGQRFRSVAPGGVAHDVPLRAARHQPIAASYAPRLPARRTALPRAIGPASAEPAHVPATPAKFRLSDRTAPRIRVPRGAPVALQPTPHSPAARLSTAAVAASPMHISVTAPPGPEPQAVARAHAAVTEGRPRPPMLLWLIWNLPPGDAAPDWAVALDSGVAEGGVVAPPPLGTPQALADFAAGHGDAGGIGALVMRAGTDWSAPSLAPVMELAAVKGRPVLYPADAPLETVALLRATTPQSMPIYAELAPGASAADLDATLARASAQARRNGLAVLSLPADPALLDAIALWRQGPGRDLQTARLEDLFGG